MLCSATELTSDWIATSHKRQSLKEAASCIALIWSNQIGAVGGTRTHDVYILVYETSAVATEPLRQINLTSINIAGPMEMSRGKEKIFSVVFAKTLIFILYD